MRLASFCNRELNFILWFTVFAPLIGALMIFYQMGFNSKFVLAGKNFSG